MEIQTLYILGSVTIVSVVSFVGVFVLSINNRLRGPAIRGLVALAAGALLGDAFLHIIPETFEIAANSTNAALMIIAGILGFFILESVLKWHHAHTGEGRALAENMHLGPMILVSDGVHNFLDGIVIGASYFVGIEVGIATTIAVILHEIPQEVGDFGVLVHAGYSRMKALLLNFVSALTAVLGALVVIFFGSVVQILVPIALAVAAGMFIYVALSDLIPELHDHKGVHHVIIELAMICLGIGAMYVLTLIE
ncbi:MAG: ZIP family metal transporter [bacterium]|nr:ZIP family metal transporter [bacterium]